MIEEKEPQELAADQWVIECERNPKYPGGHYPLVYDSFDAGAKWARSECEDKIYHSTRDKDAEIYRLNALQAGLRVSLEHLAAYVGIEVKNFFSGPGSDVLIERICHAIDHVIVDHCKDNLT